QARPIGRDASGSPSAAIDIGFDAVLHDVRATGRLTRESRSGIGSAHSARAISLDETTLFIPAPGAVRVGTAAIDVGFRPVARSAAGGRRGGPLRCAPRAGAPAGGRRRVPPRPPRPAHPPGLDAAVSAPPPATSPAAIDVGLGAVLHSIGAARRLADASGADF